VSDKSENSLTDVHDDKDAKNRRKIERIEQAKKRQAELDKVIQAFGGIIRPGLYHGNRRVRAKITRGKWLIAPDETDLISALSTDSFSDEVNHVDLRNRFGLKIINELAPAETIISDSG
jgi:hypothetical protein